MTDKVQVHDVAEFRERTDDGLSVVVGRVLEAWHEDTGPQVLVLLDDNGLPACSMTAGEAREEPGRLVGEVTVAYVDGTVRRHRCTYHLDAEGTFDRSEVEELPCLRAALELAHATLSMCVEPRPGQGAALAHDLATVRKALYGPERAPKGWESVG